MKYHVNNEKGLTLIEVIVSIVILTIVLVSFSGFFLQSTKHTKSNAEKLSAVEIAEEVIADLRSNILIEEQGNKYSCKQEETEIEKTCENNEDFHNKYKIDIRISEGPSDAHLKKAIVDVSPSDKVLSEKKPFETQTYLEDKEGSPSEK